MQTKVTKINRASYFNPSNLQRWLSEDAALFPQLAPRIQPGRSSST